MVCATGKRVSELIILNQDDFNTEGATISCPGRTGRSKRERVLPLPPVTVEATKQYLATARPRLMTRHPEEQTLLLNHHGERLTSHWSWLIIKAYTGQARLTKTQPLIIKHALPLIM